MRPHPILKRFYRAYYVAALSQGHCNYWLINSPINSKLVAIMTIPYCRSVNTGRERLGSFLGCITHMGGSCDFCTVSSNIGHSAALISPTIHGGGRRSLQWQSGEKWTDVRSLRDVPGIEESGSTFLPP